MSPSDPKCSVLAAGWHGSAVPTSLREKNLLNCYVSSVLCSLPGRGHWVNPCSETKNWAHLQILFKTSLYVLAGEGICGKGGGRPLPLLMSRDRQRCC
jgi:hypothetical protein